MKRPPLFLLPPIQTILWLGAGWLAHRSTGYPSACRSRPLTIAGWLLVGAGIALIGWASRRFRAAGTSEKPWIAPKAFVVSGPYLLTRNPMYVGMALILLGTAAIRNSPPMLLAPAGFITTVTLTWIRYEEFILTKRFGKSYAAYRSRVGRWL